MIELAISALNSSPLLPWLFDLLCWVETRQKVTGIVESQPDKRG